MNIDINLISNKKNLYSKWDFLYLIASCTNTTKTNKNDNHTRKNI